MSTSLLVMSLRARTYFKNRVDHEIHRCDAVANVLVDKSPEGQLCLLELLCCGLALYGNNVQSERESRATGAIATRCGSIHTGV
jgi:hypothetical protein